MIPKYPISCRHRITTVTKGARGPFCRIIPVALGTMATSALNALETLATGAPIMGSVRMEVSGVGSAVATKGSTAPRVRTVNQDDMASTAPQVRNTLVSPGTMKDTQMKARVGLYPVGTQTTP